MTTNYFVAFYYEMYGTESKGLICTIEEKEEKIKEYQEKMEYMSKNSGMNLKYSYAHCVQRIHPKKKNEWIEGERIPV